MIASGQIAVSSPRNSELFLMAAGCAMLIPSRVAASFTGDTATSIPRPRGRSGCVTTSGTEWPASTSFSKVGTAKRGVPQKTRNIGVRSRALGLSERGFNVGYKDSVEFANEGDVLFIWGEHR